MEIAEFLKIQNVVAVAVGAITICGIIYAKYYKSKKKEKNLEKSDNVEDDYVEEPKIFTKEKQSTVSSLEKKGNIDEIIIKEMYNRNYKNIKQVHEEKVEGGSAPAFKTFYLTKEKET